MKSFWPPLPSPESGRAVTFLLVNTGPTRAISFFFFFYRCHLSNALLFTYIIFQKFVFFLLSFPRRRSFERIRATSYAASEPPPFRRYRTGLMKLKKESLINISRKRNSRSVTRRANLGERYRLHIVDPWLMYRLSYRQAVLSSSCRFLDLRSP